MRHLFSILFMLLALALGVCAVFARRSRRAIGASVALLVSSLIPPVIGNMIIIASGEKAVSMAGCYIYFLGMDLVMFALLRFTFKYCAISWPGRWLKALVHLLLIADAAQLLCNPFFGHAFATEPIMAGGAPYYRLIPYAGQTFHRLADYGIFAAVLVIFLVKMIRAPRVYSERYSVILLAMIVGGVWQTFYIFSRTPVDRSMIGFGVFGLLVFYFSLYYRPLRLLDRMLANIASELPEALFFFDAAGGCIWANAPGIALTGAPDGEFDSVPERLNGMFAGLGLAEGDWSARRVLGEGEQARYYVLERHAVTDDRGRAAGAFLSVRDNTAEQRDLQREKYTATHDRLTDLYTREYLYERVRDMLRDHPEMRFTVAFVDVKDFKIVNDIFGRRFGDIALRRIADWLRAIAPENSAFGRLGGDTFGMCFPSGALDLREIERQLSGFSVAEGSVEHHILIHLGLYEATEQGLEVSVMFDRAHMALTTIEDEYNTHIACYDEDMRRRALWNQHITAQLPVAIRQKQLRPYLQPIVDRQGRIVGAEALVRWVHPTDGLLPPAAFIPVFENNGMIADVDRHMWRCACEILARWGREKREGFISVNVSPKDFYFMNVAAELKRTVAEYGVDPSRLRVEITETMMMTEAENRTRILEELRRAGFVVEMDDFGSGYSSLNMLKDMPVDVIKLDMAFLTRAKDDGKARRILRSVIGMAGDLDTVSLTEGVETEEHYRLLSEMGCELFQGYYFARPMPVETFEEFCRGQADR